MTSFSIPLAVRLLFIIPFAGILIGQVQADFVEVTASGDNRVLSFFPNSNEGNGSLLSLFNDGGANIQRTYVSFNLNPFAGETAIGDGLLTLIAGDVGDNTLLINGELYLAAASWDENTITWNNQPGLTGLLLSSTSGVFLANTPVSWTIPQATLQTWLDDPASNHGLVLYSSPGSLLHFHSKESNLGLSAPRLSFNTSVPEPLSTLPLFSLAAGLMFQRRHRSAKS